MQPPPPPYFRKAEDFLKIVSRSYVILHVTVYVRFPFPVVYSVVYPVSLIPFSRAFQTTPISDFDILELFISTRPTGQRVHLHGNLIIP